MVGGALFDGVVEVDVVADAVVAGGVSDAEAVDEGAGVVVASDVAFSVVGDEVEDAGASACMVSRNDSKCG